MITATYNGNEMSMYLNGELLISEFASGNIVLNNENLYIGRDTEWNGSSFSGIVDNIQIWNTALSQNQIQSFLLTLSIL